MCSGPHSSYYTTTKDENFDFNSWQKSLDAAEIRDIEVRCQQLMDLLGYQRFQPQK